MDKMALYLAPALFIGGVALIAWMVTRFLFPARDEPAEAKPAEPRSGLMRQNLDTGERVPIEETDERKLFDRIVDSGCPDCGSQRWAEGPSGGMSTNYECENGHRYNITPFLGIAEKV